MEKSKNKSIIITITKIVMSFVALASSIIAIVKYIDDKEELKQQEIRKLLDMAAYYYEENNYVALGQVYSDPKLQDNPQALLNTGVMYANGIYFNKDLDKAKFYFHRAMDAGESKYALLYLMQLLKHDDMEEVVDLIAMGCANNNLYCEEILQDLYRDVGMTCEGAYLIDFREKTKVEQKQILDSIFAYAGDYTYQTAADSEEKSIPIYVRRYFGRVDIEMIFE